MSLNTYNKSFSKRSVFCFFLILFLLFFCILRVAAISITDYSSVQTAQNSLKIKIAEKKGTIFDCNRKMITNNKYKIIAAVSPTPKAITAISTVLSGDELNGVLEKLKANKPVLCEVPKVIKCDGIVCTRVYINSDKTTPAIHLIGYSDADNNGVSGIQAAYNSILKSEEYINISYECDGKGNILDGIEPKVYNDSSVEANGVVTTIDINIQNLAEKAAESITTGAIIIADAKSGKIRASVSRPTFDCENISNYLNESNSPLLNRAINSYNVGSVFKPCVAICSIENNKSSYLYNCKGSCEIAERFFRCHKYDGHGNMNLKKAIAHSCNTYFYNLAFNLGGDLIYNTATTLRFGKSLKLCDGIYTAKGNIPNRNTLNNVAQLANFSIGQGELLLSPVNILTLYCAIASDGSYKIPSVIEGTLQDGKFDAYENGKPTRVMTEETAKIMKEYLASVLTDGTGESAKPKKITAAGKTATAQTGKFENGIEICQGWFCGFFPVDKPEYVVVIFSENTMKQKKSCSEIFAFIADNITDLNS